VNPRNLQVQANRANSAQDQFDWYNQTRFDRDLEKLKHKARSGDIASMLGVARLYQEGIVNYNLFKRRDVVNLLPNPSEALKWYQMAAEGGNLEALRIMGDQEMSRKNYLAASDWFLQGINQNDGYCLKRMGDVCRRSTQSERSSQYYRAALKQWQISAIWGLFCLNVCR